MNVQQKYWHCRIRCKSAFKHRLYYLRSISLKGKVWIPALCSTKYLTISKCPSKQAARRGVEFVFVVELTFAPLFTSRRTISRWPEGMWLNAQHHHQKDWDQPAAAAHHSGGAPSMVSPSKVTLPACSTDIYVNNQIQNYSNFFKKTCSTEAQHLSTRYSTTSW